MVVALVGYIAQPIRTQPHGALWKQTFKQQMLPFLTIKFFLTVLSLLAKHMKNPKATIDADLPLALALKRYDPVNDKSFIFELEIGARFQITMEIYELKVT